MMPVPQPTSKPRWPGSANKPLSRSSIRKASNRQRIQKCVSELKSYHSVGNGGDSVFDKTSNLFTVIALSAIEPFFWRGRDRSIGQNGNRLALGHVEHCTD